MSLLIKNIKSLIQITGSAKKCGKEMKKLDVLENAFLFLKDEKIEAFGKMENIPHFKADNEIDAIGRFVFPSYIDTHTHIVFPQSREKEFELKIKGATYEEIAAAGGGILNSAKMLKQATEEELVASAMKRINEVVKLGTGAIEIKSGYGLSMEGELKMLRVIKKIKKISPIPVKATFLGAHAVPPEYKNDRSKYIDIIVNEMLTVIEKEKLAEYIDIFIEKGFYSLEDGKRVIEAGKKHGLKPKIHVDQMNELGGVQLGVKNNAVSVDHLENIGEEGITALKNSKTIATLLPSCSFYLNMKFPPARKLIDEGLAVSIASDYNPGSSPSGNLNFSMSLACIKMKMMPEEVINAVTINAAHALELENEMGSIAKGKLANLFITKPISSIACIPYSFGNNFVDTVILKGKVYKEI
ncbi:MAG: imidazolonepropionase [Bacteroidota bacterium]|nr:imidazolonepropionase [Bacteroidota bacterium]